MRETCDDCGQVYAGPVYYTFDPACCIVDDVLHAGCTGNLCPDCCGSFVCPDDPLDPRIPPVDYYNPTIHANLEAQYA